MLQICTECGGSTSWDDDIGSAICTTCGTLTDPSQSILTSHISQPDNARQFDALWDPAKTSTLKSFRTGSNWDLAGQGKEARDRKNTYAMHEFIKSLGYSLNASGLVPRAVALFNQAMNVGRYRWGRKAKLVAGVCISIALRESKRPDALHDIAYLLDEQPPAIARTFTSVISRLKLVLIPVDPKVHITTLLAHLLSTLQTKELPPSLVAVLKPLCQRTVGSTANSLADLIARLSPDNTITQLPTPPVACAMVMLSLEAEARSPLNRLGDLAKSLGARCHVGESTVMARYKLIQDEVSTWIDKIPWLDKYDNKKGKPKLSKRLVVARGLKDVIHFQEQIWREKARPKVSLDLGAGDKDNDSGSSESESDSSTTRTPEPRRAKRQRTDRAVRDAALFLLDPLSAPIPSSFVYSHNAPGSDPLLDPKQSHFPLMSYILTTPNICSGLRPTRLQLLAAARGGSSEEQIKDDELFEVGEMENLFRAEEERQMLRAAWGWDQAEDVVGGGDEGRDNRSESKKQKRKRNASVEDKVKRQLSKRVNLEAFARFMDDKETMSDNEKDGSDSISDNDGNEDDADHSQDIPTFGNESRQGSTPIQQEDGSGEVVADEWRPLSPEAGFRYANDRYDEEYD